MGGVCNPLSVLHSTMLWQLTADGSLDVTILTIEQRSHVTFVQFNLLTKVSSYITWDPSKKNHDAPTSSFEPPLKNHES
jgi:hypothetical protein